MFKQADWVVNKLSPFFQEKLHLSLLVIYMNNQEIMDVPYFNEQTYLGEILERSINTNKKLYITHQSVGFGTEFLFQLDDFDNNNTSCTPQNEQLDDNKKRTFEYNLPLVKLLTNTNNPFFDFPRCYLRFNVPSFFDTYICDWIIKESESYASTNEWLTNRHAQYPTTDIEIVNLPPVFSFFTFVGFSKVKNLLEKLYSIVINKFNVEDLFIVKYQVGQQTNLDSHVDGGNDTNFTFSILLNNEFEGASIDYKDGGSLNPSCGDIMFHTKFHQHAVSPLTKGTRYVLVGFLNIEFEK
jgi:hypothetical protein